MRGAFQCAVGNGEWVALKCIDGECPVSRMASDGQRLRLLQRAFPPLADAEQVDHAFAATCQNCKPVD
ncbi:hypothetical protein CBM2625_U70012 [Cupriavidus taiwanensis]|nr:hypothetical protein CBM2625_U70012 [Cupriavidus taiwanensis]